MRALIVLKRHALPRLAACARPFVTAGRVFLRVFGVPAYRAMFFVRRHFSRVLLPAKNKALFLVTNRYAMHGAVAVVAIAVSMLNLSGGEVRAETFGKNSILYGIVAEDESHVLETVSAQERPAEAITIAYADEPGTDLNTHLDRDFLTEEYATTETGVGTSDAAPASPKREPRAPERTEIVHYAVEQGDTPIDIARKFGLSLSTIQWANDLSSSSTIRPGQELVILPTDGVQHEVESGDTLSSIARKYGANAQEVEKTNKLANANDLRIGEQLLVPGGEPPTPTPKRVASPRKIFAKKDPAPAKPEPTPSTPAATDSRGSAAGRGTWVWPTDWRVITQYYGWRHTGIDVDGDYSTYSYAASGGTVIYTGWRSGYGLTVEVDHGGGIVTRYAHHSKNLVNVGDTVAAGETLAVTGTTGRSTGTHLHFEVIKNGKFQNPLDWVR